jgi:ubiquinone/menaquinone biosynthesis C-methylase UbiE
MRLKPDNSIIGLPRLEELESAEHKFLRANDLRELHSVKDSEDKILYYRLHRNSLEAVRTCWTGDPVLDVGCAQGNLTIAASSEGLGVVGMDIRRKFLTYARSKDVQHVGSFLQGDAYHLPIKSSSIKCLLANQILEHLSNADILLSEFNRVLIPNGHLIVGTPNHDARGVTLPSYREFRARIEKQNLDVIEGGPDGSDHLFLFKFEELLDLVNRSGFQIVNAGMHSSLLYNRYSNLLVPLPRMELLLILDKLTGLSKSMSLRLMRQLFVHARKSSE